MSYASPETWAWGPGVYAAWVPSISGQLSFSMFGEGEPFCVHTTGMVTSDKRAVALIQRRVASDFPWPWIFRYFSWAAADFAIVAETRDCHHVFPSGVKIDDQGALVGSIYLLQRNEGGRARRMRRLKARVRRIIGRVADEAKLQAAVDKIAASVEAARLPVTTPLQNPLDVPEAQFVLYRSGEFRLQILDHTTPNEYSDEHDQPVPTVDVPRYKAAFAANLAQHFYFFVRDMAHRHRHHSKGSDSLLPVISASHADDKTWRRETAYNLSRAIIEANRDDDLMEHKRALGIMAYATAFQDHLAKVIRSPQDYQAIIDNPEPRCSDWTQLSVSIEAQEAKISWAQNAKVQNYALLITVGLSIIALWFAIAQVGEDYGLDKGIAWRNGAFLLWLAEALYYHPLMASFWGLFGVGLAFMFVSSGFKVSRFLSRIAMTAKRFGYAIGTSASVKVGKTFPVAADFVGAAVGGLVLLAIGLLSLDLGQALLASGLSWDLLKSAREIFGNLLIVKVVTWLRGH